MKGLDFAGRALLADLASTLLFLSLYELTHNIAVAVGAGIALALAQIGWKLARRCRIDALQWVSLFLVISSGAATLITRDPRFVMLKPTVIYLLVGLTMMRRGWMLRYMSERAMSFVPDLAYGFGYVWAGMMFFSAALNLILDFSMIEEGAARGAPKYMEWYSAFGLMVTLVWLYLEIIRLLSKLRDNRR